MPRKIELDPEPTGEKEENDFSSLDLKSSAQSFDADKSRNFLVKFSFSLSAIWLIFLVYIIVAQGNKDGVVAFGMQFVPHFNLQPSEFIAVVTSTTIVIFGFLLVIVRALFSNNR